jgi:thiol-disulfide isomerase/thioredoxin
MNKNTHFYIQILFLGVSLALLSCASTEKDHLPVPQIQVGIAKVSGKVIHFRHQQGELLPVLNLRVSYSVTAEKAEFKTQLNEDGSFFFEIPMQCKGVGWIQSDIYSGGVCLVPDEETILEITLNEAGEKKVTMQSSLGLTSEDMLMLSQTFLELDFATSTINDYRINPDEYTRLRIKDWEERLKIIEDNPNLSSKAKEFITYYYGIYYLSSYFFFYSDYMHDLYMNSREDKDAPDDFVPQEPGKSYYSFLKYFDINNPKWLYSDYYMMLRSILSNNTLNIPPIEDIPIKDWLKEVKATMTDLIGSDTGLFYDMLVANAYARQFHEKIKPLSETQIENIKKYFKNKSLADILLTENEKITKVTEIASSLKVNDTPIVPKEELMNEIISKYKGKVVVVNFWATWCRPCLEDMEKYRELNTEMLGKGVVFLYLTDVSSPKEQWKKKIQGIGGEHYYLTEEEWNYILLSLDFNGRPAYLFYDANGVLKNKSIGDPGTNEMRKMIEDLLP